MEKSKGRIYVAINMTKVVNNDRTFETIKYIGPKVCMLTASSKGFLGYQANVQTGILPWAGHYGGADLHMERELNPVRLYQYTMWQDQQAHLNFHQENFARFFELCVSCSWIMVAGPWEPVYEVVSARMLPILGKSELLRPMPDIAASSYRATLDANQRSVAITEYTVKADRRKAFEQGVTETVQTIAKSPGFLGFMLLRPIAINPLGSLMLDPESAMEALETIGANPPADPKPLFASEQANPSPPEYLLHTEWETPEYAQSGLEKVLVNHESRMLHMQHVMPHLIRGPYTVLYKPMMEDPAWREGLAQVHLATHPSRPSARPPTGTGRRGSRRR